MGSRKSKGLLQVLGLNELVDRLVKTNGVRYHRHVLRRKDDHVLRIDWNLELEDQRRKLRRGMMWRKRVKEE